MPPFLQFVIRRFLVIPVSLLIITLVGFSPVHTGCHVVWDRVEYAGRWFERHL